METDQERRPADRTAVRNGGARRVAGVEGHIEKRSGGRSSAIRDRQGTAGRSWKNADAKGRPSQGKAPLPTDRGCGATGAADLDRPRTEHGTASENVDRRQRAAAQRCNKSWSACAPFPVCRSRPLDSERSHGGRPNADIGERPSGGRDRGVDRAAVSYDQYARATVADHVLPGARDTLDFSAIDDHFPGATRHVADCESRSIQLGAHRNDQLPSRRAGGIGAGGISDDDPAALRGYAGREGYARVVVNGQRLGESRAGSRWNTEGG